MAAITATLPADRPQLPSSQRCVAVAPRTPDDQDHLESLETLAILAAARLSEIATARALAPLPHLPADASPEDHAARETARREAMQTAQRTVDRHQRAIRDALRAVALELGIVSPREG